MPELPEAIVRLTVPEDGKAELFIRKGATEVRISLTHNQVLDILMRGHEAMYRWYRSHRAKAVS